MSRLRLQTKFLLSMLLISAGLTCTSLLLVRRSVHKQVKKEIFADLQNSVSTFQNFQRERELSLSRSAELLADLPTLRALMTTQHAATIQDASAEQWRLAGSDIFVLADRAGRVAALHTTSQGFTREMAQASLNTSFSQAAASHWWYGAQHLYEVCLKPIYFGPATENRLLGFLAIGYEIDDRVASQVSRIAASQVAFYYGDDIVRSTLAPAQESELARHSALRSTPGVSEPLEMQLGDESFLSTSVELARRETPSVRLSVLKSYDQATAFLDRLNRLLLALGLAAVVGGSILVFLISHTFTRPLGTLVNGVRALEKGDFTYALDVHGGDEDAEVTGAFKRMRDSLLKTQQKLLDAERLATIGRMASSISHDLRHSLTAIVANAEFLSEPGLTAEQREDFYREVRTAESRMTDLIDSLLEFSWTREALRPCFADAGESVRKAVALIQTHPEFHRIAISISDNGQTRGWFDPKKLERVLYNLLLNACEVIPKDSGEIRIELLRDSGNLEISVGDNGPGIPDSIHERLFEPFVTFGKESGSGLGLAVAQKIVQDHGGEIVVQQSSAAGSVV